jgi:hypothetical protein
MLGFGGRGVWHRDELPGRFVLLSLARSSSLSVFLRRHPASARISTQAYGTSTMHTRGSREPLRASQGSEQVA